MPSSRGRVAPDEVQVAVERRVEMIPPYTVPMGLAFLPPRIEGERDMPCFQDFVLETEERADARMGR